MKFRNKNAFTLAEILIALSVVGVVAVLTLPSVIQKQQEKITVNRLKTAYSIISQAFARTISENGTPDTWGMGGMYDANSHIIMGNAFVPYLKLIKNCIGQSAEYTRQNCNAVNYTNRSHSSVVLNNGISITFRNLYSNCSNNSYYPEMCGVIIVDINGMKNPNSNGTDIFLFWVTKTKIVPLGTKGANLSFKRNCDITDSNRNTNFAQMSTCAAWVLYNENMDYLHCSGLDWDGKHSCKE